MKCEIKESWTAKFSEYYSEVCQKDNIGYLNMFQSFL